VFENTYVKFFSKFTKRVFLRFLENDTSKTQKTLSKFQKEVYQIASLQCAL